MIKFWLGGLYLRGHPQPSQAMLNQLSTMIRDTTTTWRMTSSSASAAAFPSSPRWRRCAGSRAPHPARLVVGLDVDQRPGRRRLAACLAEGRVADPQWTEWLLGQMRQVRGGGNFASVRLPRAIPSTIAIKNRWNIEDGVWYVNCLAIGDTWVLATESRAGSFITGRDVCVGVTEQLLREPVVPVDTWLPTAPLP